MISILGYTLLGAVTIILIFLLVATVMTPIFGLGDHIDKWVAQTSKRQKIWDKITTMLLVVWFTILCLGIGMSVWQEIQKVLR